MPNPIGAYEYTIPPQELTARIPEPDPAIVDFDPIIDPMSQYLDDWTDDQQEYLGLPKLEIEAPKETENEKTIIASAETEPQPDEMLFDKVINGIDFSQPAGSERAATAKEKTDK